MAHPSQSGKLSGRGDGGSTAWSNAVRSRIYLERPEEGGKNDRILTRKKSNYAASGDDTALELEWRQGVIAPKAPLSEREPDREECRQILRAIAEAWGRKVPWSHRRQTRREGRYAPANIARQFNVDVKTAAHLIEKWLQNGVLAVEIYDTRNRSKGLKVMASLD